MVLKKRMSCEKYTPMMTTDKRQISVRKKNKFNVIFHAVHIKLITEFTVLHTWNVHTRI